MLIAHELELENTVAFAAVFLFQSSPSRLCIELNAAIVPDSVAAPKPWLVAFAALYR